MASILLSLRRYWAEIALAVALVALCLQLRSNAVLIAQPNNDDPFPAAENGAANLSLRTADYPDTHICSIHVDLTSPHHWVTLAWFGPLASKKEMGPFHSSPGKGLGDNNCDDNEESNRWGSNCTPKGLMHVEGFNDFVPSAPECLFVTWINVPREIAFHSNSNVPDYPASHGCIRLNEHAAQLIHNNSISGKTEVVIDGTWRRRNNANPQVEVAGDGRPHIEIDSQMTLEEALDGVSPDCPRRILDRQELVDVTYYSFDNQLHRGQIVVDRELVDDVRDVFDVIRELRFPIASVIPISHSSFRKDGRWDDELSMRRNNTSAFNYRETAGGNLSYHALGRAIDINPVQNPFDNEGVIHPAGAVFDPSVPGTLTEKGALVQAFIDRGWEWGGRWVRQKDYQHFEKSGDSRNGLSLSR